MESFGKLYVKLQFNLNNEQTKLKRLNFKYNLNAVKFQ